MLTPAQINALSELSQQAMQPVIDFLLDDIARRISEAGQFTSSAAYQIWRAQALGVDRKVIEKELRKRLGVSQKELKKLLVQSAEVGYNFDMKGFGKKAIPFAENRSIQQIVEAAVKLADKDFRNITQTLGFCDPHGKPRELTDAYITSCDYAFNQVITGATDYNTAIRNATKNLAEKGISSINYESGRSTSLEAAVRRNIMSGLGLMQEQISQQNHDAFGADGWEISAHAASATDHEDIQGKQYTDKEYEELNNSLARRIGTLHCGHAAFPIILGVNEPQYTPEQLQQFKDDNKKGVTYNGKHYTVYEATQKQRSIERAIRLQKRRAIVAKGTGDKDGLLVSQVRLRRLNEEYGRYSKAVGLPTQRERTQVGGFGAAEATDARTAAGRQIKLINKFTEEMASNGIAVKGFETYIGDADTLYHMSHAYSRMAKLYPEEAKGLTIAYSYTKDDDVYGWFDYQTKTIHFSKTKFKNWTELEKMYAEDVESKFHPQGTTASACFYHEFGHAVDHSRGIKSSKKSVDKILFDYGYGRVNANQRENALIKELSLYSTSNTRPSYQEVVAESFAEWYNSDSPRRFCEDFLKEVGYI